MKQINYTSFKFFCLISLVIIIVVSFNNGINAEEQNQLPPLQTYPLPSALETWSASSQDDYFDQIQPHAVGYLIWSEFPLKVYLDTPDENLSPGALARFQQWQDATQEAIATWHQYLPMQTITSEAEADILIYRRTPELKTQLDPETGLYNFPRVKAATTSVKFYLSETQLRQLRHRMVIEVNPRQTFDYLVSNLTHEIGHALGIWGHSSNPQDVMYYSHTQEIPQLSERDLNTLKKIYQQPTRLSGTVP